MEYYETLYIVHPTLESGRLKDIISSVNENLKKLGGNIYSIDLWGKKKLAYFIDKEKYGTYVKMQFSGKGDCNQKLAMELEHNSNILSYLTISIKENELIEQEADLESQIAGYSRDQQQTSTENLIQEEPLKEADTKNAPSVDSEKTITENKDDGSADKNVESDDLINNESKETENNIDNKEEEEKNTEEISETSEEE